MAWGARGAAQGIQPFTDRLARNDPSLSSLVIMRFRRFEDADVAALCAAMQHNTSLMDLTCSSHVLSAAAAAQLGAMLGAARALRSISIGNSTFGSQGMAALAAGLAANTSLQRLDLESKGLCDQGAASLAPCLRIHPQLSDLLLSSNAIGDAGVASLCVPWLCLERLELRGCSLGAGAAAALTAAPSLSSLRLLDLGDNELGPDAGPHLAALLGAAPALRDLRLGSTALGDAGVASLATGLAGSASLVSLDLSRTGMAGPGCAALAAGLESLQAGVRLERLVLGFNAGLGDGDVQNLARALQAAGAAAGAPAASSTADSVGGALAPPALDLDLSGVAVGAAAVEALEAVRRLQALTLLGTNLSGGAAAALAAALAGGGFPGLADLNLAACQLSMADLGPLLEAVGRAGAVTSLAILVVAANPAVESDGFEGAVDACRAARPGLDVHWRGGPDGAEGAGAGGPPGVP